MAERGATPNVPALRRRALRAARVLFTPLLPDDYLELVDPLWTTRELRGRVEQVRRETDDTVTVLIKPGWEWPGHRPGQYLRVGVVVDGVHHWRAYSLTSAPGREDGLIGITPKLVEGGTVSSHLVRGIRPGTIVRLGGVEGTFTLPDPPPARPLFFSAGSGITPIMAMLRALAERPGGLADAVHVHSARTPADVVFGPELRALAARHPGLRLHEQHTAAHGRMRPGDLDRLVPDWRERETFASGPADLLDALTEHYEQHGDCERLWMERFQPVIGGEAGEGEGGTIKFLKSDTEAEADGSKPILVVGEEAGLELPFGCRMGICHTCTATLTKGRLRDLRSGEVTDCEGQVVRTCVNAPEGDIEIEL
jgi:ferredoxin-NADP reductase